MMTLMIQNSYTKDFNHIFDNIIKSLDGCRNIIIINRQEI